MENHTSQQSLTSTLPCPCGKTSMAELERIPRGILIKTFLFWLPLKRYRCIKCTKTKLILTKQHDWNTRLLRTSIPARAAGWLRHRV